MSTEFQSVTRVASIGSLLGKPSENPAEVTQNPAEPLRIETPLASHRIGFGPPARNRKK